MSRREKTYLIPSHRPEGDDPRDILMSATGSRRSSNPPSTASTSPTAAR
ncbi:MAG: hypothetical protein ACLVL7_06705 [Anaerotruncus massiliensis (ex Togo et al. 2019)]